MATQRFIVGVSVFDTYAGLKGEIVQMNLMNPPVLNPYTANYSGKWFIVQFVNNTLQMFTDAGRMVDHTTGSVTTGITLLTLNEYNAVTVSGYPPR